MGKADDVIRGVSSAVSPLVVHLLKADTRPIPPTLQSVGIRRPSMAAHRFEPLQHDVFGNQSMNRLCEGRVAIVTGDARGPTPSCWRGMAPR